MASFGHLSQSIIKQRNSTRIESVQQKNWSIRPSTIPHIVWENLPFSRIPNSQHRRNHVSLDPAHWLVTYCPSLRNTPNSVVIRQKHALASFRIYPNSCQLRQKYQFQVQPRRARPIALQKPKQNTLSAFTVPYIPINKDSLSRQSTVYNFLQVAAKKPSKKKISPTWRILCTYTVDSAKKYSEGNIRTPSFWQVRRGTPGGRINLKTNKLLIILDCLDSWKPITMIYMADVRSFYVQSLMVPYSTHAKRCPYEKGTTRRHWLVLIG